MNGQKSAPAIMESFIGTWALVSCEFRRSDGEVIDVLGKDAIGVLMYDAHGQMSGQMMRLDRPHFASGDQQLGTPEELKAALGGYIAYFGDYEVDEQTKTVIHHTKGSMFPNVVGQDQKRFYEFSGSQLILKTPPFMAGGLSVTGVVLWEKR